MRVLAPNHMTPGERIGPNLELVRPLAAGGMGSVWVARHHGLRTDVAVKVMHADLANNSAVVERFGREASLAANVKSPHIVQQLDVGISELGAPYIVMELLHGEDLEQRLARERVLEPIAVAEIVRQTSRALEAAHAAGVVHRDIKPANLYLVENAGAIFIKVLDFGIAKTNVPAVSALTQEGTLIGTPSYMSPEQLFGLPSIDGRADLWALAVVAFEALTGTVPFSGQTLAALGVSVSLGQVPLSSTRSPALGMAFDAWFQRALAPKPEARFDHARALADAFDAVCIQHFGALSSMRMGIALPSAAAQPPLHVPASVLAVAPKVATPPRPYALFALALLVGLLVLGVGAVIFVYSARTADSAGQRSRASTTAPESAPVVPQARVSAVASPEFEVPDLPRTAIAPLRRAVAPVSARTAIPKPLAPAPGGHAGAGVAF